MKVLFYDVYVGIKMTLFSFVFIVSTLAFVGESDNPRHACAVQTVCLLGQESWLTPAGALTACTIGTIQAKAKYHEADVMQAQVLLGRKWRTERNWWISTSTLLAWIVVYRLNVLLKQLRSR